MKVSKQYEAMLDKQQHAREACRQDISRFLQYVADPELVAGTSVHVHHGHPSGLGGQALYIPRDWRRAIAPFDCRREPSGALEAQPHT